MSFINWSDPEEMVGLLAEYVADEHRAEREDHPREIFLEELSTVLNDLASSAEVRSTQETIDRLREIYDWQGSEFAEDPALRHLDDCIQELERIMVTRGDAQSG